MSQIELVIGGAPIKSSARGQRPLTSPPVRAFRVQSCYPGIEYSPASLVCSRQDTKTREQGTACTAHARQRNNHPRKKLHSFFVLLSVQEISVQPSSESLSATGCTALSSQARWNHCVCRRGFRGGGKTAIAMSLRGACPPQTPLRGLHLLAPTRGLCPRTPGFRGRFARLCPPPQLSGLDPPLCVCNSCWGALSKMVKTAILGRFFLTIPWKKLTWWSAYFWKSLFQIYTCLVWSGGTWFMLHPVWELLAELWSFIRSFHQWWVVCETSQSDTDKWGRLFSIFSVFFLSRFFARWGKLG